MHPSRAVTNIRPSFGSNDGVMKLVAPATAGQTVAPFSLGVVSGSTFGRPSAPISFAHVVLANGLARSSFPVSRSST
jgi:hypothetical protein